MNEQKKPQKNNVLAELLCNILIPVIVLEQLGKRLGADGPLIALVVAVSFPVGYFVYDYKVNQKKNMISFIGLLNILMTGGFALLKLEGHWFAIKEASFPLIIGGAVFISSFTQKPFIRMLVMNDQIMDVPKIENRLQELEVGESFHHHIKKSTLLLSASFLVSAVLNYVLAVRVFSSIPIGLSDNEKTQVLNEQIAQMTWMSYLVILLPSMVILGGIMWHFFNGLKRLTGLGLQDVLIDPKKSNPVQS